MPNAIKYSASAQTLALKKGNYWIGTGDVGKGPTSTTDYWNGITPPAGGYTIYLNKASGGPSIYTAANDSQLVSLTNTISSIPTNYISNGGNFSNGTISPFIYDYTGAGGVATVVSIANDRPYEGSSSTNALELNYNGGRAMDTTGLLTVGQTYTFSFWAKVTSGSSFSIGWNNQNGSGDTNSWSSGGFTITTSWQRYSQVFTYNAARTTFYFYTRNQTVGTLAVFTEFQLSLGSAPCGPGLTTATESINWFLTQTDKMVFSADYPAIVTNGLVLNLDAGFTPSITSLPTNIVGGGYNSYTPVWYDLGSGGNNGSLINSPTYSSSGGGSIALDGADDYISIPHNSAFNFGSGAFTISLVISSNQLETFTAYIKKGGPREWQNSPAGWYASSGNGGGDLSWYWVFADGTQHTEITPFSTFSKSNDTFPLNFFTITRNSSGAFARSWNGSYETLSTVPIIGTSTWTASFDNSSDIWIGRGNNNYLNGSSAICRIYNRDLSQAEILQNYNAQKGRFGL